MFPPLGVELSWLALYNALEWVIRIGMVPVLLRRRFPAPVALAWLSIVFFLPVVGLVAYGLLGAHRLGRARAEWHRAWIAKLRRDTDGGGQAAHVTRPTADDEKMLLVRQAEHVCGLPILGGNDVDLLAGTDPTIERLLADVEHAEDHVHLLFYIFVPDETGRRVAEALARAAERGVTVRLLADAAGSRGLFKRNGLAAELRQRGVYVRPALPVRPWRRPLERMDLRNHRKIAVIDGRVGYTGSQNIVEPHYHKRSGVWVDLNARLTGPVVGQLQLVFVEDWAFETGEVPGGPRIFPPLAATGDVAAQAVPTGPDEATVPFRRVLLAAIHTARRRLVITTPYFVPDEPTLLALSMAADRGVATTIVIPAKSDHPVAAAAGRANFGRLLQEGVEIYHYPSGLLHAKTMTVDDTFAMVGSPNMDIRSFQLNYEISVLLYGEKITQRLRAIQSEYLAESARLDLAAWERRSAARQYADSVASLFAPLL